MNRVELVQHREKLGYIFGAAAVHDVEVERGERRAMKLGGGSTHDDELDPRTIERGEESGCISDRRMRHA